jgi:predicted transcriptional regulator
MDRGGVVIQLQGRSIVDRELASALADLGMTATEAEVYTALLAACQDGPVSAYKLAQDMGRDPANTTKTLGAMTKRGAVRASGRKPKLYAPVDPAEFTGALVARLQARQQQAVQMLAQIGKPPADEDVHALAATAAAVGLANGLINGAERVVLVDAAPDLLAEITGSLEAAAARGATVLVRTPGRPALDGVRCWQDDLAGHLAPGPWLRLAADGAAYLEAVVDPGRPEDLLYGVWSRNPVQAFLGHRALGGDLLLADALELLASGAGGDVVRRRVGDQAALVMRQVGWRQRWQERGLAVYRPDAGGEDTTPAPSVAEAPQPTASGPDPAASDAFEPELPGGDAAPAATTAPPDDAPDDTDDDEPLTFVFRKDR